MAPDRSAVVFVLDRLGAPFLGPYGNTWIDTPAINRLASESFLVEHALTDTPNLDVLYRSFWLGQHAFCHPSVADSRTLTGMVRERGVTSTLLTDDLGIAAHSLTHGFDDHLFIDAPPDGQTAEDIESTHLGRLTAVALDWLDQASGSFLLWIHAQSMNGPWDAPLELRRQFADVDDPVAPDFVDVPSQRLETDYDPDELLGITHAYAGQISALDVCVGSVAEAVRSASRSVELLFVMTSARGFPLGEHLRVGAADEALYSELLHVPCILRLPDRSGAMVRSPSLSQPRHLHATLLDWFSANSRPDLPACPSFLPVIAGDTSYMSQRACATTRTESAIRTPAWFLRCGMPETVNGVAQAHGTRKGNEVPEDCELFVKPDDRWDVNEVSDRCPEVVVQMREELERFACAARSNQLDKLPPLPDVLAAGF